MQVGVLGGTGFAGSQVVAELERRGHGVRALSRASGVDVASGQGAAEAVAGLDALVDCLNARGSEPKVRAVLVDGLGRVLEQAAAAGVGHVTSLAIIGSEHLPMGYYRAKLAQQAAVVGAPLPSTVIHTNQFFDLLDLVWRATAKAGVILAPRGALQPIDARDVAALIADTVEQGASAPPHARIVGPEVLEIAAMARDWKQATHSRRPVVRLPAAGAILKAIAAGELVDRNPALLRGRRTWDEWLAQRAA